MSHGSRGPVIIDTGVFGARLTPRGTALAPNAHLRSLASAEAQAANADVPNFATGGVTIFVAYD